MATGRKPGSTNKWKPAEITRAQESVRAALEEARTAGGPEERLALALRELAATDGDATTDGAIRRYVLAVSLLVHSERFGGMTLSQSRQVFETGLATLRVSGIDPSSPRHAFLYGDLHQALSMVYRRYGRPQESMWQLLLARRHAGTARIRSSHQLAYALAQRAARLGSTEAALGAYELAAELAPGDDARGRCRLGAARTLRAAGRLAEASARLAALAELPLADSIRREISWEQLVLAAQTSGDLGPMLRSVRRGGPHYAGVFVLEAHLWAHASATPQWSSRLTRLRSVAKDSDLRLARRGALFRFAVTRANLDETDVPLEHRLADVGKLLDQRRRLLSLDQEALALASLARWFARWRLGDFKSYFLEEYRGVCLRMSGGTSDDTLRLLGDLREGAR